MKAKIGFIVLAVSTVVSGDSKLDKEAPLSVCGLLEHRLQYNGKMVHVRGIGVWRSAGSSPSPF